MQSQEQNGLGAPRSSIAGDTADDYDGAPLAELLNNLEDFQTCIPDNVTVHYLRQVGFDATDPRVVHLLALAAQKFVSDVVQDAMHFHALRHLNAAPAGGSSGGAAQAGAAGQQKANAQPQTQAAARGGGGDSQSAPNAAPSAQSTTLSLTLADLAAGLSEYGVQLHRPPYYM